MIYYVFTCLIAFFIIYCLKCFIEVKRSPPGPWGVPVVGYYPLLGSKPVETISKLADKYGEIMTLNYFGRSYYYLNSLAVVKQVFVKQTNYTSDRPPDFSTTSPFGLAFGEKSLVNSSGDGWKKQHTFMLSKISDLGMGKTRMEDVIFPVCEKLVNYVTKTNGRAIDFYEYLTNYTSNVISGILFNQNYDNDDPQYVRLRDDVREFFICCPGIDGNLSGTIFHLFNGLKGDCCQRQKDVRRRGHEYFLPIIEDRIKQRQNTSQDCTDLLDYFVEKNFQDTEYFEMETIAENFLMWFVAGTETSSSTLYHALNLMILHPEIQEKVYKEIDSVFGSNRQTSYQERHLLPYTQAVIQEVQRFVCLIPFGIVHSNSKSVSVTADNGTYILPEKSCFIANIWKLSRDPKQFKNPENFDPNNFLNEKEEFVKNESNMPFVAGKRMCIGASLASMELFIAFVTLLQKFRWKSPNQEPVPRIIIETQARVLKNFTCCAEPRN